MSVSDIFESGFNLLREIADSDEKLFFHGRAFPVVIDEKRYIQGDDLADTGIDLSFSFCGAPHARLPKDSDRVRVGKSEGGATPYRVSRATYHPGSMIGTLTLERRGGG